MSAERALIGLHGSALMLALAAALVWPRPGQAALMVPLGGQNLGSALDWADREQAELIELDSTSGRIVARISNIGSAWRAITAGIVPIAIRAPGCGSEAEGVKSW